MDRFPLLGTRGQLTLQFFNDRLFEIGFRPDDASACARSLKAADSKLRRDANGRAERTSGSQRIATNCDLAASDVGRSLNTEPYVLWQDLRLVRQRDRVAMLAQKRIVEIDFDGRPSMRNTAAIPITPPPVDARRTRSRTRSWIAMASAWTTAAGSIRSTRR